MATPAADKNVRDGRNIRPTCHGFVPLKGYGWWLGGELTFGGCAPLRSPLSLRNGPEGNVREDRNRPQGRYQFLRGDPSGSLCFRGGDRCPLGGPTPLLGHAGWRLEGGVSGDGRSKSGLRLHSALISIFRRQLQPTPAPRVRL